MPLCLFFSYEPVISLGGNESMNFELSVPLIWLVMFDLLCLVMIVWKYRERIITKVFGSALWWLFPFFVTFSVVWSLNPVRGLLTAGVMWGLIVAIVGIYEFREYLDARFWRVFLRWFLGSSLLMCGVLVLQCVLDIIGVDRGYTLMCAGCTYHMFGFPHPDGFAIEPQFMGNLLLAPAMVAAWLTVEKNRCKNYNGSRSLSSRFLLFCFFVISATLFLTFSRGAIYAFGVGMVVMSVWGVASAEKRMEVLKRVGVVWVVIVVAFVATLNTQGLMAEFSPTNDTYKTGVAKVLNHLTLGVVDIREESDKNAEDETAVEERELESVNYEADREELVENSVENFENEDAETAAFDGYVAESTDTRLRLTGAAVEVWRQDATTMLFGVGLGGAGQALYENGLSPAPKEIVQNQYASLLLETGMVGVSLFVLVLVLAVRVAMKSRNKVMVISLMVAYGVSLCFFSGLPNALHIYLMPIILMLM